MGHRTPGLFPSRWANACVILSIVRNAGRSHISIKLFFHKSLLNVDPCSHFLLLTCSKLQNELQLIKLKRKRHYLWTIWKNFLRSWTNLADQRLLTIILFAFCSFMRFSEGSRLRRSDFIFSSTYVKVFIEKNKTDIYREGMWFSISASRKNCPIK